MKKILSLFLFALALGTTAHAAENSNAQVLLKKSKEVFDVTGALPSADLTASCVGPGYRCRHSGECCGASFCHDNVCSDSGNSCRDPGAACQHSGECCGSSFCRDGYCSDNGNGCRGEGARCNHSGECCGSLFCRDGFCS